MTNPFKTKINKTETFIFQKGKWMKKTVKLWKKGTLRRKEKPKWRQIFGSRTFTHFFGSNLWITFCNNFQNLCYFSLVFMDFARNLSFITFNCSFSHNWSLVTTKKCFYCRLIRKKRVLIVRWINRNWSLQKFSHFYLNF